MLIYRNININISYKLIGIQFWGEITEQAKLCPYTRCNKAFFITLPPNIVHSCIFCTIFYRSPKLKIADIVVDVTTSTKVFKLNGHTFLLILGGATGILLNLSYSLFLLVFSLEVACIYVHHSFMETFFWMFEHSLFVFIILLPFPVISLGALGFF